MREPGEIAAALPRPGRALKGVLALLAIVALIHAILAYWVRSETGVEIIRWLVFQPGDLELVYKRPWTLVTSGLVTDGFSHILWSLVGLYFLTTDLERRWGGWGLIRFLALAVIIGNLTVLAARFIPHPIFQQKAVFGPLAAIAATAIAWSKENRDRQMRFMFFLPMSGRVFMWITIGGSILAIVFAQGAAEGAVAPLGGVVAGLLLSGSPSPVRSTWLRFKLMLLRRKGGPSLTVESITGEPSRPRTKQRSGKAPPLRVVIGGLDEDLKNRKPPKDKRFLN